jgi:hypothetical protein
MKSTAAGLAVISSLLCVGAPSDGIAQDAVGNFSDFLIDRANDNYIYLFEVRLKANPFFGTYFPHTLKTAGSGDLRSLILNRSVWRESFESDMKDLLQTKLNERMGPVLRELCSAIAPVGGDPTTLELKQLESFLGSYKSSPNVQKWKKAAERLNEICAKDKRPTLEDDETIRGAMQPAVGEAEQIAKAESEQISKAAQNADAISAAVAVTAAMVATLAQTDTKNDVVAAAMLQALSSAREAAEAATQARAKIKTASTQDAMEAAGAAAFAAAKAALALRAVVAASASQHVVLPASDLSSATQAADTTAATSAAALKAIGEAASAVVPNAQVARQRLHADNVVKALDKIEKAVAALKGSEFLQKVNANLAADKLTEEDLKLAAERPYVITSSPEERIQFVVATLSTIAEKFDAARSKCRTVRAPAYTQCALALADFVDAAAYGLSELRTECTDVSLCVKDSKVEAARFRRYAVFFAQLGDSGEKLSPALLKNVTVPPVSFGTKRQPGADRLSMSAYFALGLGYTEGGAHTRESYVNLFVPVGLEWSHGSVQRRSHSIFFSGLDFGIPVSQKLNGTYTSAKFSDLIAPGVFYVWGYKESPLAWGVGFQRVMGGAQPETWGNRFLVFWGFDLPLLMQP